MILYSHTTTSLQIPRGRLRVDSGSGSAYSPLAHTDEASIGPPQSVKSWMMGIVMHVVEGLKGNVTVEITESGPCAR
jgi:hypothetical protein